MLRENGKHNIIIVLGKPSLLGPQVYKKKKGSQSANHSTRNYGNFFGKFAENPILVIFTKMRTIQN